MTGLETAFYIVGLVFMGLSLLLLIALLIAILAIRAKLHALQRNISHTFDMATDFASRVSPVFNLIRRFTHRS